jgi:tRNA-dihydrouridine synthase 3
LELGRYLLSTKPQAIPDDDAAEGTTSIVKSAGRGEDDSGNGQPSRRALAKAQKKARQGANKGRRFGKVRDEVELCWKVANGAICDFGTRCVLFSVLSVVLY